MPEVVVRSVREDDLDRIAELHLDAFPESAISAVGVEAARRYYEWQCEAVHDALNLVAEQSGRVVGFCFAGHFRGAMGGYLRKHAPYLIAAVVLHPSRMRHPIFRKRTILGLRVLIRASWRELLQRVGGSPASLPTPARDADGPRFGILAIATDPSVQGSGVGRLLMAAAEAEARRRGCRRMRLSVHPWNKRAVRFYEGLGWERVLDSSGSWKGDMQLRLDTTHA